MERFNVKMLECYRPIQGERWNCWLREKGKREEVGKLDTTGVIIDDNAIAGEVEMSTTELKVPLKEDADIRTGPENNLRNIVPAVKLWRE